MIRNLKTLGVALCAALAFTVVAASAASADYYTASSYPATVTGASLSGNENIVTEAGTVSCEAHFQGTLSEPSSHLTITPIYSGELLGKGHCSFASFTASVSMNGCQYTLETPETVVLDSYRVPMEIVCPAAKSILIKVPATGTTVCELTIGGHTPSGSIAIDNNTPAGDMTMQAYLSNIAYSVTKDGFGCPFAGTGPRSGAVYSQTFSVTLDSPFANISASG